MTMDTHYRVCNLCEAMCGLAITVDNDNVGKAKRAITIKPDRDDPFSKGSMCPKAPMLAEIHNDPERLRHPVKRDGDKWVSIEWNEAIAMVCERFSEIRSNQGKNSIASYLGNPIVHNLGMLLYIKQLTNAIGSRNVFSATSMDQLPHHFAAHHMFGHEFRIPVPDVDRTNFMIMLGANPIASNGSIMTSAGIRDRLKSIHKRGGRLILLDPRRTETAELADEHWFIKPGTDVYFLLAFLHVLFRTDQIKPGRLESYIPPDSIEILRNLVEPYSPSEIEPLTGVSAARIESLVSDYMQHEHAVIYGRMGVSTQKFGGLCHWLINTINIVSGHFDKPGGMMFPKPAIDLARSKKQSDSIDRWSSRVRGLPEFYGELPVSVMAEEMLTEGEGQVKGFMTVCGNPVLSTPNGKRLEEALPKMEFMVSMDNYINETTRHADLILPTPSGLEIDHYDIIFNLISVTDNVKFSEALFPASSDRPYDWQILKRLITGLAAEKPGFLNRTLLALSTPRRLVNWGLMLGPYGCLSHPKRWFKGISLKRVIDSEHGISMGPLKPRVPEGLVTNDRMIHLTPEVYTEALRKMSVNTGQANAAYSSDEFPLRLIGRRHVNTNNSWMHQYHKLSSNRQVRCTAMMNPADAEPREIHTGAKVHVTSVRGSIEIAAEVTDAMMPGVVCIPHGFGHHGRGTRVSVADAKPGVSVNDITDEQRIDTVTNNAAFSGLPLEVIKISDAPDFADVKDATELTGLPIEIVYGSRTGNAEYLARDSAEIALKYGLLPTVTAMMDATPETLAEAERVLVICSTYGEGDMPDNAESLWQAVQQASSQSLSGTGFAVLALGDRSYKTFCEAGKNWDRKLEELGGSRLNPRGECDVDYEDSAAQWLENIMPVIAAHGDQSPVSRTGNLATAVATTGASAISRRDPWSALITEKKRLSGTGSTQEIYHLALSIKGSDWSYAPGDSVNLIAQNATGSVEIFMSLLGEASHDETDQRSAVGDNSMHHRLREEVEWIRPSRKLLLHLAKYVPGEKQNIEHALNAADPAVLESWLDGRDVLDLLQTWPQACDSSTELLPLLTPLQPRAYSIASSPLLHADEIHITVSTVRRHHAGRDYPGLASGYIADQLEAGDSVKIFPAPKSGFDLPADPSTPIIMIGPGTGLAPFRAFLQHLDAQRKATGTANDTWLFFGNPHRETDFLYHDELEAYLTSGTLKKLDLAFSRDQVEKVYVQHRLKEQGEDVIDWLQRGASVYVCGDATHMAADVDSTLRQLLISQEQLSDDAARQYLQEMKSNGRYLLDVY